MMIELLRENKRMLDKSIREIERERQGLQTQEKKLIAEIKKVAKQGQMVCPAKLLTPPYVLLFYCVQPSYNSKSLWQSVSGKCQLCQQSDVATDFLDG
jgi:charged multivesicular body protein 2A